MLIEITDPSTSKKEAPEKTAVGIDLGTTRSLVAIKKSQKIEVIPQKNKSSYLDSAVTFKKGSWVIADNTEEAVTSFKRFIGKNTKDFEQDKLETRNFSTGSTSEIRLQNKDMDASPIELSSVVLSELMEQAQKFTDKEELQAVITVPAYFDDAARAATLQAARLAGIDVLRLLNEPTAAALAYGLDKNTQGTYLVYDLGGGTFDISILKMTEGVFKVIATNGDTKLGGDDFDYEIAKLLMEENKELDINKIISLAKNLKEKLTYQDTAEIYLEHEDFTFKLGQHDFEVLIEKIISRTIELTEKTIKAAKLNPQKVNGIILVGGSTRIPLIRKMLSQKFGIKIYDDINPDEAVVKGAAIQAYNLTNNEDSHLLIDVNPLSIGLEVMGGLNDKIIERNSTIPLTAKKTFTTYADGQTGMKFHIVQGEREFAKDCRSLCEFEVSDLPTKAAGAIKIEVTFNIDANGVLNITAEDKTHNIYKEVEISPTYGVQTSQINEMLEDSLKNAKEDVNNKLLMNSLLEANQMIHTITRCLQEDSDLLNKEEMQKIQDRLDKLQSYVNEKDRNEIDKNIKLLEKETEKFLQNRLNKYLQGKLKGKNFSEVEESLSQEK